jgi:acetolactate synthase I/II/III large subunit
MSNAQKKAAAKTAPAKEPPPTQSTGAQSTGAEQITGGRLLAKALKNEGVDAIFTLTDGEIVDIFAGCIAKGIRVVDVRHEQVATHAADGYARLTSVR